MWSFKQNIYKTVNDTLIPIACGGGGITFSGDEGIYERDILLGTDLGFMTIDFNAQGRADRIEILYDGVVVADSLFVGDVLLGGSILQTPAEAILEINTVATLPRKIWNGVGYDVVNPTFPVDFTDNDIADASLFRSTGDNLSLGGVDSSLGVQPYNFGSQTPIANSAADGHVRIGFNKTTALPSIATLRITGVNSGTVWDILGSTCPT